MSEQVYNKLVEMGRESKSATTALERAKSKLDGAYTVGVEAAALAGSWPVFETEIKRLEDNIRKNRDNLAVRFGAEKRKKVSKAGDKYQVPSSVMTVKTQMKWAFENGISLSDEDGNPRAFKDIKRDRAAIEQARRDEKKAEEQAQAEAALTGDDKKRHEVAKMLDGIKAGLPNVSGKDLTALKKSVKATLDSLPAEDSNNGGDSAGEALESADGENAKAA